MKVRRWVRVCSLHELEPGRGVAALVGSDQVAIFLLPDANGEPASRIRAVDNRDPVSGANVLARGILGWTGEVVYVASPMHKNRFDLDTGRRLDGEGPGVRVWPVRVWGATVEVLAVNEPAAGDPAKIGPAGEASEQQVVSTHCPFCALQCAMRIKGAEEILAEPRFPVNEGRMCVKGWSAVGLLRHPDRLTVPLVRDSRGRLAPASWEEALEGLARRLSMIRQSHGPEAIGVFGSGTLSNEAAYLLGKFARLAIGTPNIDYNGRFCMSSAAAAQNRAFGVDRGLPFPVSDIAGTDTLVLWGANPADTMPPFMNWVQRMRDRGGRLIVVDPRVTATAEVADEHVQIRPGSDLAVALGLLHLAIDTGAVDLRFIEKRTSGWKEVSASVEQWGPTQVERLSGIAETQLRRVLQALASPPAAMLLSGRGPEQQSKGTDTVSALINLMLALGRVGKPFSGYGCLTGQANGQGGREHGQKADQLPGYRSISDPPSREHLAALWGLSPDELPGPGRSAVEMLESIGRPGGIKALLVAGSDLAVAAPDSTAASARLGALDCLAVLDPFLSGTAELADFVLPVALWAESDSTVTNLEGRVIRRRRATPPPLGVRSDVEVLCDLAGRLGRGDGFHFNSPDEVFDELARASAGGPADYSGMSYQRLDLGPGTPVAESAGSHPAGPGLFWPCDSPTHPGTPRLFGDRFAHPDGRARFVAVHWRPEAEPPDSDYPLRLTTGRYREQYNSGNQTRRLSRLVAARPQACLEIHPSDAYALGVLNGARVLVESRRGRARFAAVVTTKVEPGTVFAPFHWPEDSSANLLTGSFLDPLSKMPEFKVCAVRVSPEGLSDNR